VRRMATGPAVIRPGGNDEAAARRIVLEEQRQSESNGLKQKRLKRQFPYPEVGRRKPGGPVGADAGSTVSVMRGRGLQKARSRRATKPWTNVDPAIARR